jgi:predicted ATP-grasp superfamily ATP-dependent carboligase
MKVLIPGMEKRSALAATRSLGRKGIEVIGCSEKRFNAGFFSKYCKKKYIYRSPFSNMVGYVEDIFDIISKEKPDILLPVNEETLIPLLADREKLEKVVMVPLPDNKVLNNIFDKVSATKLAEKLEIPCPKTIEDPNETKFTLIVRPRFSRQMDGNKIISKKLYYVFSKKDLESVDYNQYFVQEYVSGQGYGFYALFDKGNPITYFMMKRIHEVPFYGGPSSLRESIQEEKLKEYGLKILKALNWHGLVMVEFRRDERDDSFKFIEINGRIWGSLALSISAGVDFPYLLCQMVENKNIFQKNEYKIGVRGRWLSGEMSYLSSVFFGKKIGKRPPRIKSLLEFFGLFEKKVCYDYFAKDDIKPGLVNLFYTPIKIFKKLIF